MSEKKRTIIVSHINIRQSIFFMVLKLIVIDIVNFMLTFIIIFPLAYSDNNPDSLNSFYKALLLPTILYTTFISMKLYLSILVVLKWLNEYYEIEPLRIIHRTGIIFRKEEHLIFRNIMTLQIHQSTLGKLFNYGTITLIERFTNQKICLYLIHNPMRYYNIICELLPDSEKTQDRLREHFIEYPDNEV